MIYGGWGGSLVAEIRGDSDRPLRSYRLTNRGT